MFPLLLMNIFAHHLNKLNHTKGSRLTMDDNCLNDLLVIAVENDEASIINLDEALGIFANMKNIRYPLIC